MRRKIVLWGTNEEENKILVALHLLDKEGKVKIYSFGENLATEEFYKQMLGPWRDGVEVAFPEGYKEIERPLNITDSILPDEIKVDRTDIINRAQTEWHFVVLSAKLFEMYRTELDDLKETVEGLKEFDSKVWNEMKAFWGKVQEQVNEKNLFREHASTLKTKTNRIFDDLKKMKKKLDEEFEAKSAEYKETFMTELGEIEQKVEKGLGLKPIFEELKSIQNKFRNVKFTRKDRDEVWKKIDNAFKVVKEKRFGEGKGNAPKAEDRLQRRYDGLINAIKKMERSIARDKDDQKYQDRKISTTEGQLEAQIRLAKIKMIEERISSKEIKLADMLKTKVELENRIQKEKEKVERRKKMEEAKAQAEAKIAEEVKKSAEKVEESSEKLEEAVTKVVEAKKENKAKKVIPPVELPKEEVIEKELPNEESKPSKEAVKEEKKEEAASDSDNSAESEPKSIVDSISEQIEDVFEDVVDTVKAVAEVVEDKIEDAIDSLSEEE